MSEQQLPSDPAMELLDGDATAAQPAGPSLMKKLARGTMYGVVMLGATALLAVSAVPELADYATFGSAKAGSSCGSASGSSCATLDTFDFSSPSSVSEVVNAAATEGCGGCPFSTADADAPLLTLTNSKATSAKTESCCSTISRASLVAASTSEKPACCLEKDAIADLDLPIDAGSLLATAATQEAAEQQSDEQQAVLAEDDNEVEE